MWFILLLRWNEWLTHHYTEFIKKRLETVVMLCPRIAPLSNQEGLNQVNEINKEIESVKNHFRKRLRV